MRLTQKYGALDLFPIWIPNSGVITIGARCVIYNMADEGIYGPWRLNECVWGVI